MEPVPLLTQEEIAHFKREGYVIKFGLLDPELMRRMRERLFAGSAEFGGRIVADDPSSWVGPLRPDEESGSGMHGLHLNSRAGTVWKERLAGGEELMLDMLPRRLDAIAEQLLGKNQVLSADGSSVGQMLGVPDDENFVRTLGERGQSDIGAEAMWCTLCSPHRNLFPRTSLTYLRLAYIQRPLAAQAGNAGLARHKAAGGKPARHVRSRHAIAWDLLHASLAPGC